ncbi:acyl-CoA dehydrogenase family protein [Sphingomonas sp. SRS2]|uniref:acyl-CoA dehydrogenase family protein n=1 Tax=Sphingomonas sp. SRS2 TaxID=133190 RepID=UPI0006184BB7|nr:acyl-CoA dehydrogenase family protein [Sphingomonas sp. SRS2]KKC27991.1 hypothetical protein WP12_00260 [Sphingomonas sp. SRS2]
MAGEKLTFKAGQAFVRTQKERLAAARTILPLLTEEADRGEALTHLTDAALNAMRDEGLLHLLLPRELDGEQVSFVEAMEIVELLAWADGSAGWYAMVANTAAASVGAYIPEQGAQEIYGRNSKAMVAGQGGPRGMAKPVDGGYLINGPWAYGSTIFHADFYHSGCIVVDENGRPLLDHRGDPRSIVCHFPSSEGSLGGNWDTLGLRATGSYDYDTASPDLFVPDYMAFAFTGSEPCRGGSQYSIGIVGFTAWCHASWALGAVRRALDEIRDLAPRKAGPSGPLAASATFRQGYAAAEAKYRSARAFLYETWRDIDTATLAGRKVSVEQLALARMGMRYLHDVGSDVTTFAYRAGGGVALRASLLQRAFRDMHAATQHMLMSDQIYQECGRVMLGLVGENARWVNSKVVDE